LEPSPVDVIVVLFLVFYIAGDIGEVLVENLLNYAFKVTFVLIPLYRFPLDHNNPANNEVEVLTYFIGN